MFDPRISSCRMTTSCRASGFLLDTRLCQCCLLMIIWIEVILVSTSHASGYFEVQLVSSNPRGELSDSSCCTGSESTSNHEDLDTDCSQDCQIYFRLCLKEYQIRINHDSLCRFGNTSSGAFRAQEIEFQDSDPESRLVLPFDFAWTVSGYACMSGELKTPLYVFLCIHV